MEIEKKNVTTKEKRSIVKFISNIFFGEANALSLEQRVFVASSAIAFFGTFSSLIWNLFLGLPLLLNIVLGVFILLYFLLFYYARFKNIFSPLIFIFISLLFLSLLYIMNGGLTGSIPVLYIVFIGVFVTISNHKYKLHILLVTLTSLLSLILAEFFLFKNFIILYSNNEVKEMDLTFGYIISIIISYFLISYFKETITFKNKKLQKLNANKDLLFNIIAHDLRGPFNSIIGFAGLMTDKSANLRKDELQKYAEQIKIQSQKTFELLESLLEWGRIQSNKTNLNPQSINLYQVIHEIVHSFKVNQTINEHEIKVEVPSGIFVIADMVILKTILRNLISNAFKFTPTKEKINISVEEFDTKHFIIIVKDYGIGMKKEILENLFNLDIDTNRIGVNGESSVGLGLIITKKLIEKQGSKLIIESEENKGSTFKFTVQKS